MKRAGIYLRVSTNQQTTENQRRILTHVAERSGWTIVGVLEDQGISGAKERDKRPGFDTLLNAIQRREIDVWTLVSEFHLPPATNWSASGADKLSLRIRGRQA